MNRAEIPSLTGLRAVAALWVLGYHLRPVLHQLFPGYGNQLLADGYLGVDVFFVLSGFILAFNYGGRLASRSDYAVFLGHRIARIYPLHVVVLLGMVAVFLGAGALGLQVREEERFALDYHLPLHLTMTHAWGFEESLRFNQPSWSVSAEFFAYLLFPVFWWIASRADRTAALVALAGGASFGGVLVLRQVLGYEDLHVATHHALVRVSGAFLAGTAVYRVFAARADAPPPSAWASGLAVAAVVATAASPLADWAMPVAACVLVYGLARGAGAGGLPRRPGRLPGLRGARRGAAAPGRGLGPGGGGGGGDGRLAPRR
ncbi:MAG: acyltransferase, partial [Myxococcota bacterium]|nr:acyltransferase [Myxococcota bacterium]